MEASNKELEQTEEDPLCMFMYGLRAKESRRQYPRRLKVFMDFCGLEGSLEKQAGELFFRARVNVTWLQNMLIKFIEFLQQGDNSQRICRKFKQIHA